MKNTADEKFVIDIKQSFLSSKYVKALSGKLQEWGIEVSMSSCIPFNTPTDKMRKGVRRRRLSSGISLRNK